MIEEWYDGLCPRCHLKWYEKGARPLDPTVWQWWHEPFALSRARDAFPCAECARELALRGLRVRDGGDEWTVEAAK